MKGGMAFLHRDKRSAAGRAYFAAASQRPFDSRLTPFRLDELRGKKNRRIGWKRTQQLDRVIRRHGAGWAIFPRFVHEVPGRRPIAVAVEKRADDPAV